MHIFILYTQHDITQYLTIMFNFKAQNLINGNVGFRDEFI